MPRESSPTSYWSLRFLRHFAQLQVGLFLFGVGLAVMLEAQIGLDPWSTFHEGASLRTGLSFGRVVQIVGALLIVFSWLTMQVRPGIGTVSNMLFVGPWVDLIRVQPWIPHDPGGILGVASFCIGMVLVGLALATYIGAKLGAGPRDGFILAMAGRLGRSIRATRVGIELVVLACGFALGGPVGLGTVLFAVLMGPIMQAAFRIFGVGNDPSPTWRITEPATQAEA